MENNQKPQKICFVITKSNFGGAQKYVYTLASNEKIKSCFNVTVLTGSTGELNSMLTEANTNNITTSIKNTLNPLTFLTEVKNIYNFIKRNKIDIIHANSSKAGIVCASAFIFLKIFSNKKTKLIFTAHGWAFNESRNKIQKTYIWLATFFTVLLSSKIICVSSAVQSQTPLLFLFEKKVKTIYNGLPILEFYTAEESQNKLKNILTGRGYSENNLFFTKDNLNIVTIAELNDNKNHLFILNTLSKIKNNFTYHIIGEGNLKEKLEKFIIENNLQNKVFLYSNLKDAYKYLKAFNLFILSSKTEAFGYVLQEAVQSGIKTIASKVGGTPELLPKENLFKISDDGEELINLINNFDEIKTNIDHSYLSQENMITETINLYKELTS